MRGNAEAHAGGLDGGDIGGGEILLTEMHIVGTGVDRLAPVVVDDELAAVAARDRKAFIDLPAHVHRQIRL